MNTGLAGKVALVTASSKGLGLAVARVLASEGAAVAMCAREPAALRAAEAHVRAAHGEVLAVEADLRRLEHIERLVESTVSRFGGLDVLVTNAGGPRSGTFDTLGEADWQDAVELTLMSVVRLCRAAVPHLRTRGAGRIINITSVSVKQPIDGLMLSNALRAAVVGFSKTLATELAKERITVNCVAPGYHLTDRVAAVNEATAAREGSTAAEVGARLRRAIPAGRYGEPDELAALVAFLASDRAGYVTGTTIQIDGGFARGLM